MMLGDGCLSLSGGKNAFIRIQHSEKQKEYLESKANLLRELTDVNVYEIKPSGKKNPNTNYACKTRRHPLYTRTREIVYKEKRKTVTSTWLNWLDERGLAIWFMDDGSLTKSYRTNKSGNRVIYRRECLFATCSFTLSENQLLVDYLLERFGLQSRILMKGKYPHIKIMTESANLMFDLIRPYIVPCMDYKLDMEYQ
jgi:hypothetical protein